MVGAVQHRPRERVEAGIDEQILPAPLLLDRADLGDQIPRLSREVASRLDLEADSVPEAVFEPLPRRVPELEVAAQVGVLLVGFVGHGQAAAGTDHGERTADLAGHPLECPGHLGQMGEVSAAADVHVEARHGEPGPLGPPEHLRDLLVPDSMLRALAAGVCFLAVAVTEAGIHPERDRRPRHPLGKLFEHVGRAAVDVDAEPSNRVEALAIEDVGGVDDRVGRRQGIPPNRRGRCVGGKAGGERPVDLAGAHRVNQHPLTPHEIEHGDVRAGLLREANSIPGGQVAAPLADHVGVVGIQRRAVFADKLGDRRTGDLAAHEPGGVEGLHGDHERARVRGRLPAHQDRPAAAAQLPAGAPSAGR